MVAMPVGGIVLVLAVKLVRAHLRGPLFDWKAVLRAAALELHTLHYAQQEMVATFPRHLTLRYLDIVLVTAQIPFRLALRYMDPACLLARVRFCVGEWEELSVNQILFEIKTVVVTV